MLDAALTWLGAPFALGCRGVRGLEFVDLSDLQAAVERYVLRYDSDFPPFFIERAHGRDSPAGKRRLAQAA